MPPMPTPPLPSIALVLTTDHTLIPRRPSVIKIASSAPCPAQAHAPHMDMMQTIRSRDYEPVYPANDWRVHEHHARHVTFVEENDPMDLAESIYDEPVVEDRSVVIRRIVKDKLSNIAFTLRRVLRVDFPQTCLTKITRF